MADQKPEPKGVADSTSSAYVIGGVPFLMFFFVGLFGLWVGGCDTINVMVPF